MSERRTGKRLDVSLDATWDGTSGNYTARVSDLSEGGCYMDTLAQVFLGESVKLKLNLPNGDWLELTGEVVHHTPPFGFGIRFIDLSDDQLNALHAFLKEHPEQD